MNNVSIEDFSKLDIRVGEIKSIEEIKKSQKLLKIIIDIGEERQVVAGIKPYYNPEDLLGKKVIVLANLEPAKLMGVESRGMILAAQEGDNVVVLTPDKDMEKGAKIR